MNHKIYWGNEVSTKTSTFFDYLMNNSQVVAMCILDKHGIIIGVSYGVQKTYGYSPEDLIGKHFSILYSEEDRLMKKPEIEIAKIMEQGYSLNNGYVVDKNGSTILTSGESVFVKDSDGEIFFVKIIQHFSQDKLLEELLVASENRKSILKEILNSIEQGLILFKTIRNNKNEIIDFEYLFVNAVTEKLLSRSKHELMGKHWLEEYPYMKEVGTFDLHVKTIETGRTQSTEFYYGYQGFNKWYTNKFIKVGDDRLLVTFDDITDQKVINKKLEEKVKQRTEGYLEAIKELKSINEYLDKYAYIISHDLKAPLAAIEGLIPFLKEDYSHKSLDQEGNQMLDMIKSKTKDMRNIIDEVLKTAKKEQKEKEFVNIYHLVQKVIETLNPPKQFHIFIHYALPLVFYNRVSLMQVFQNLIGNSIKYMDKVPSLIQITSTEFNDYYLICICDNGPGISKDKLEIIFNPFATFNTKDSIESHGIGLSIVKQIVEENGGKVWVESKPGLETKFHFTIPK